MARLRPTEGGTFRFRRRHTPPLRPGTRQVPGLFVRESGQRPVPSGTGETTTVCILPMTPLPMTPLPLPSRVLPATLRRLRLHPVDNKPDAPG